MNYQNERIGVLIGITDITGLKIEKEEVYKLNQFHKSIVDNETIWLSVSDLSANVILWNKAAEYISGYSQNEVLGHNKVWEWLKFNTGSGGGLVTKKGHTKIGDTVISDDYESSIKRKDGGQRIISWTSRMFYDNNRNPMGTIAIGKDITELKDNEKKIKVQNEELLSLNKHLEEMVRVRTNKIQDLLQQKNDFINQLGHDLKTPLTPMMVLLPLIKKELEKPDKKEIIDVLIRNTTYMKDLITKTIELAKLNSDMVQFSITSVNLFNEIDFILSNNNYLFEEKHISVLNYVSKDLFVQADVLKLHEILLNIVTNSVKYTPDEGGEILIDAREQDEMVQVSIKDTGIGMKPEQIHKIFDEFYKADESRHNLDSSGLGLNIAKRLVEMHKGHIWAESEGLGRGSTFCFTLMKTK
jgi:PAS domain S-box-containing protein